jgi:protein-tyrosine sulfotransferase
MFKLILSRCFKLKILVYVLVFVFLYAFLNIQNMTSITWSQKRIVNEIEQVHKKYEKFNLDRDKSLNESALMILNDLYAKKISQSPLIFVGGYPRSGTTLMRAMLDVHPDVSCGPETIILPPLLSFIKKHVESPRFIQNFGHAGFNLSALNVATALFVYNIMEKHIKNVDRLCAKDPDILYYMEYLHGLFPKAKFVYMIRDGRAAAYSSVVQIKEDKSFRNLMKYMRTWNMCNNNFYKQCSKVGKEFCKMVRYEELVSKPKETMQGIVEFLGISWTNDFLKYNEFVGDKVAISKVEWASDQIKKPIHTDSVKNWIGNIPDYNENMVRSISYLKTFGYVD